MASEAASHKTVGAIFDLCSELNTSGDHPAMFQSVAGIARGRRAAAGKAKGRKTVPDANRQVSDKLLKCRDQPK
jgi:hypothetical protein